ncbi:SMI1/KNR4 family protein [Streptomyces sp. NPDC002773]|uniref:SMI1/KNR4 family protein n=1 Tax=Streptomyces sp. NPDC002773 TaxID=3154430 RepID=UPI003321E650
MTSWDGTGVRARIRAMAAQDPECTRFGSDMHRYELTPALPEGEVAAFEEKHGIALPAEYRSFVTEVGNGPAGPAYGVLPLTEPRPGVDDDWAVDDEWREDRLPGRLATPFPLPDPLPGALAAPEKLTPGTLTLAEEGCGMYIRLILTGPRAGEVWRLDPDWAGFTPASPNFHAWYTEWLQRPWPKR